ncbi:pathogenicity determinant protein PdpC [Francisella tularensis]|uniref:Pathogenicity determinant protein pdpC n=1 Tax=Francisella tularensis subsp. holarctica (strain LVS) TaxID=376619 RepID=A0AAI8BHV0_FRATH|nr:type VI secretion system effector PdpC [Francisella tularensis]EBA52722.1 hypothetical protein FTHG_01100 [Francisella tularensis subsp. holarctica 257]AJI58985.1 putative pathogenicity determinant protein pdpC [Francisella tularensis subsp. holarctica LVS]AJI59989.1 putative pathogenicity determinant protein pdpC [Francisella tularensis subsp. holarctica LVS]AJI67015.1 putative pathogenicity determinant protein pdpC [Francisella tularensis subsp. holarctica]AZP07795.1 hypothetical protein 
MNDKYELNIYFEKIELPKTADFNMISKHDIKELRVDANLKKKIHLLQFDEDYLAYMRSLRAIHPSKIAMQKIKSIRNKKNSFIIAILSLDKIIHKTKFITFGHKTVIFDFKKLWGLVDFVIVHTSNKTWVNHKLTSFMPSITYCNQNIIHLAYHSDFLYIYHTPEFMDDINVDRENRRRLVAKIPDPYWVRADTKENKINITSENKNLEKDLKKITKLKNFEISANDIFFSKAIKAAPRLQHKNKSKLFNSLAIENNEKIKRDIIDYAISNAWYKNDGLLENLMTFLDALVVRHLYLIAVYSVYEIEIGIKSVKPEYSKLLKAGLLNKDIQNQLIYDQKKISNIIWLGETFHGLDIEEAQALCEFLDEENINPKINPINSKKLYKTYKENYKSDSEKILSFTKYKEKYNFLNNDKLREEHANKLSSILEDPKFRVLSYINAFLCSTKNYLVPYGYLGSNPLTYYNCMLETGKRRTSKEAYFADIRNKLFIVCYLPGFLSSVIADDDFIDWYSNKKENQELLKNSYLNNLYNSKQKYIKDFIDLDIIKLLKQTSSQIKPSYIPVAFRYGAFASTTALIRSNANVSNRMEFELYDSPERLHNQYLEKEEMIMPKSVNNPKDHSIDNGVSLFSLNLTNEKEDGLRKVMLKVAQLYNLDFKVGISGNLDQAMTQALILGMATTKKNGDIVIDEDQVLYMTYLYCIFMAHSVDHTVDEILMSSNTYMLNSKEEKYPIANIANFFARPVFKLSKDKEFKALVEKYENSIKPNSKVLKENYISRVTTLSEVYEDIYNLNCLYSSLSEGSLYNLLSTHSERNCTLLEQYSRKKKAETGLVQDGEKIKVVNNYNGYAAINQYQRFVSLGIMYDSGAKYSSSHKKQIEKDFNLYSPDKEQINYLKYNFKDNKFDAVYKNKKSKEKTQSHIVYAKKQNTRYCYGYFNNFFVKNRITTFYKIKDKSGNYLVNLHNEKYSFATPNSDSKIYRASPELLNNRDDFKRVSKDIIKSYKYISFDKQKEDIVKNFGKNLYHTNYEIWVGLSHQAISCFSVLDNIDTQEAANTFIDALYYIRLMQLYYGKTIPFLLISSEIVRYSSSETHYYIPTEENFENILKIALNSASKPVIERFLIILNIYNNTIDDNTLILIRCRLTIILFEHEEQKLKLKALQKYADAYKKNNYKNEINFRAWFESIFHVQNLSLSPNYIGNNILILSLVEELKPKCSEYKKNMINQQIIAKANELNFYQLIIRLIEISTYHRILTKSIITNTTSLLYDILNKPEFQTINKSINKLFIYKNKDLNTDKYKAFHTKLITIEKTYKKINSLYKSDFFKKISS